MCKEYRNKKNTKRELNKDKWTNKKEKSKTKTNKKTIKNQ